MPRIRQQHWFWLAGICLVGSLSILWSHDVPVADNAARHPVSAPGTAVIRRPQDLRLPERPPPVPVVSLPPASPTPAHRLPQPTFSGDVGALLRSELKTLPGLTQAKKVMPAAFEGDSRTEIPRSVWLSGRIEIADSGQ